MSDAWFANGKESCMRISRTRLWAAGLVAFLLGFPFTEKVFAGAGDIVQSSLDLGLAIADSAGGS